jgi:uncharacterized membrane protein
VALLIALHVLAVVVWVGGMFFAYVVLRPSAGPLQSEARLALWQRVFSRFFRFVWASVIVLIASGYGMIGVGNFGFASAPLYVNLMQGLGIAMVVLFLHLYFAPWRRFSASVERSDFADAANQLGRIRRIVGINLVLGMVTIIVGASGRFW